MTDADRAVAMFAEIIAFFCDPAIPDDMKDTAARTIVQYLEIEGLPKPLPNT